VPVKLSPFLTSLSSSWDDLPSNPVSLLSLPRQTPVRGCAFTDPRKKSKKADTISEYDDFDDDMSGYEFTAFKTEGKGEYYRKKAE
jgi:hypothetical protein